MMIRKLIRDTSWKLPRVFASSTPRLSETRTIALRRDFATLSAANTTIYALSSGYGKCGVAVIRISGPEASQALQRMTRCSKLEPRKALLKKITDPQTKEVLDRGLCLWFPGPNSFTGEDSVEFHVHGGPAVISSILHALSKLRFYPAGPGEFTRRAFFNGKLDLTEAEAIGDLIDAETEKQRKQAARQADGALRKLYDSWRLDLKNCCAELEADIDFSEEHDLQPNVVDHSRRKLQKLARELSGHLSDGRRGEILRTGVHTVILGVPNAGKSSLLNILSGREAAIVTSAPGTTRDVVEVVTDVSGYPVILADTAGIRDHPENLAEEEGIRRARSRASNADLILCLIDAEQYPPPDSLKDFVKEYTSSLGFDVLNNNAMVLPIVNKIDLLTEEHRKCWETDDTVCISCRTQEGLNDLTQKLTECLTKLCGNPSEEDPVLSRARHRNHLERCLEYIESYFEASENPEHDAAVAFYNIRCACRELGQITGHISTEEILDVIFKKFCVGK